METKALMTMVLATTAAAAAAAKAEATRPATAATATSKVKAAIGMDNPFAFWHRIAAQASLFPRNEANACVRAQCRRPVTRSGVRSILQSINHSNSDEARFSSRIRFEIHNALPNVGRRTSRSFGGHHLRVPISSFRVRNQIVTSIRF